VIVLKYSVRVGKFLLFADYNVFNFASCYLINFKHVDI